MGWRRLAGVTCIAILTITLAARAAQSQEDPAEEIEKPEDNPAQKNRELEEIIVTATRRAESLQDVPISLNVVSGDALELAQENELSRLSKFAPSLRFIDSGSDVARSVSIRGVGTNTFSRGVEQSVGTAVDGVVSDSLASSLLDFGDVERIEVLHGPQGMLFGKNASAGLINIITRRPTWDYEAGINTSWADGNEIKVNGFLSGPLHETLAGRVYFFRNKRDPYIENRGGRDTNDRDEWALRAKLEWRPIEDLSALFTYRHAERSPRCCGGPAVDVVPGGIADRAGVPRGAENDEIDNAAESNNVTRLNTYILDTNWDVGGYTLSSITSYTDGYSSADVRLLFPHESEGFIDPNAAVSEIELITQELRVTSPIGEFAEWISGLYYYGKREDFSLTRNADLFFVGAAAEPRSFGSSLLNSVHYENMSFALFGNLTLNLTDRARVTAGLRWNYDDVSFSQFLDFDDTVFPRTIPETPLGEPLEEGGRPQPVDVHAKLDDHAISWRVSAELDVTEDAMIFASAGQGYKGPAANTLPTAIRAVEPIIAPEIPTNFEIGLKSEWWDRRIRVNSSFFYTEFKDFQTAATRIDEVTELLGFFLANAGKLETKGVEVELLGQLTPHLTVNAVGAYIDARFNEYVGAPCYQGQTAETGCVLDGPSQDLSGKQLGNSPDWSFTIGGRYGLPLTASLDGYAMGSYTWRDTMISGATGSPRTRLDSYGTMDMALGIDFNGGEYSLQVFAKNLFDEFYQTGAIPVDVVGINRGHSLEYTYTRRIGVALSASF